MKATQDHWIVCALLARKLCVNKGIVETRRCDECELYSPSHSSLLNTFSIVKLTLQTLEVGMECNGQCHHCLD